MIPEHMRTKHGYAVDEVASAVQKCIRRGLEEDALYWAYEMMHSPNKSHQTLLWNRLKVIATEDIGPGDFAMAILIDVLWRNWKEKKKEDLYYVNAVIALCRSPKSRINDNAVNMFKTRDALGKWEHKPLPLDTLDESKLVPATEPTYDNRNVPGFALDRHTRAGKAAGLGKRDFYEEGAKLVNCTIPDPYEERAIAGDLELEKLQEKEKENRRN
jgi:replication-associated recombination protein RarA